MDINNAKFFEDLCFEDCQCIHGAVGGGCNFYTKACECGERAHVCKKNIYYGLTCIQQLWAKLSEWFRHLTVRTRQATNTSSTWVLNMPVLMSTLGYKPKEFMTSDVIK